MEMGVSNDDTGDVVDVYQLVTSIQLVELMFYTTVIFFIILKKKFSVIVGRTLFVFVLISKVSL